jgi:hypothetical protein
MDKGNVTVVVKLPLDLKARVFPRKPCKVMKKEVVCSLSSRLSVSTDLTDRE